MKKRYYFFLAAGLTHLALVSFGAAKVRFFDFGLAGRLLENYGLYSGSSRAYDFFAPGVGPNVRAQFDVFDRDGKFLATDVIQTSSNRECYLRVSNIVDIMGKRLDDPVLRKRLGASWAAKVLARHPGSARVSIRMEQYDVPSMLEYQRGIRYGWEPLYQIHFGKKRKLASE